jgi:hypothetical protein
VKAPTSGHPEKNRAFGPGIVELRHVASRIYGIRVDRRLLPKFKNIQELSRANPKSDLFCVQVDGMNDSPEGALKRFKEIVARAGLGSYFGVEAPPGGVK